jgi:hypothetical protein
MPEHEGGTFALGAGVVRRYLGTPAARVLESGRQKEVHMYPYLALSVSPYPNSALSAGQLALIAIVPVLALAAWLILVFVADRQPRHHGAAGTGSLPQQPGAQEQEQEREQPERKAA